MSCIVKACKNSRWHGEQTITFHRIPKDPLRRTQWADNCKVAVQDLKPLSFVCSDHFAADCFKVRDGRNTILTMEAAPTVFNCNVFTNDSNDESLDSLDYLLTDPEVTLRQTTQPQETEETLVVDITSENCSESLEINKLEENIKHTADKPDPLVECRLCLTSVLRENSANVFRPFVVTFILQLALIEIEPLENTSDKMCRQCEQKILQARKFSEMIVQSEAKLRQRVQASPEAISNKNIRSSNPEEIFCASLKQENDDDQVMQPIETCLVATAIKKEELSSDEETVDQDEVDLSAYNTPTKPRSGAFLNAKSSFTPKPKKINNENPRKSKLLPAYKPSTYKYTPKPAFIQFSKFICVLCSREMSKKRQIALHMKRKHKKNLFKCQACRQICHSEYGLRSHKAMFHFNEKKNVAPKKPVPRVKPPPQNRRITFGKFRCHFCDHEAYQYVGIKQHILKHHLPVDESVKCDECQQVFNHPDILKMHVRNLHKKKKELCNLCGKLLSDIFSLRQHIEYSHEKIKYRCKLCPTLSVNHKSSLRKHMRKVHAIDTKIRCDLCQTVFKTMSQLKMHIYGIHLVIGSLDRVICEICRSEFENDILLELHMKAVHPSVTRKRQSCVACNINFDKVWQLTEHLQQHASVFVCPGKECDKSFTSHNAMACHHHHVHKLREINCNSCDYVTKSVAEFCRHFEDTHRNETMVSNPG